VILAESFIGPKQKEGWNDFVGIFVKSGKFIRDYKRRVCDNTTVYNAYSVGEQGISDHTELSEPKKRRLKLKKILSLAGW
jgi:hypothetical protein